MTLSEDITEQIVVKAGDVVLDSNGHNINVEGNDAIVVDPGASLIIEGQGTVLTSGSHNYASLYNRGGSVVINGGTFNAEYLIETDGTHEPAEVKIKNGTFNVQEIVNPGEDHAPGNIIHVTEISGGVYANKDIELSEYLSNKSDLKKYILSDGSVLLAQSVVFDSSKSTINLVVDGDTASLDLPELVLQYGDIKNYPGEDGGAVELKGNKVVAMKLGTAKITVTFDGRTK